MLCCAASKTSAKHGIEPLNYTELPFPQKLIDEAFDWSPWDEPKVVQLVERWWS